MMQTLLPQPLNVDAVFPTLSRRLRLGVVGGGRISRTQAMAARLSDYWEVVAGAFSSDAQKSVAAGSSWHVDTDRCYGTFAEMAQAESKRRDGVDAVMITTPNHLHHAAASVFLHAGIAVLCDKPLTNTVHDARELLQLVNETAQPFGVGYVMSCYPMVQQAREIVRSGGIGRVVQIHVEFMQDWMVPDGAFDASHVQWRIDPAQSGNSSCTADIGTHAAHMASFVSGLSLQRLRADMHVCGADQPLEDTVFMNTEYDGAVPGTLIATRLASGNRGGLRLRVYGTEGGIEWDMEKSEQLKFNRYGQPDQIITRGHGHGVSPAVERLVRTGRGFPEGLIEAWANLYTGFAMQVAAHRDGIELPADWQLCPPVEDGVRGVEFVDTAVRSHRQGGVWLDCNGCAD